MKHEQVVTTIGTADEAWGGLPPASFEYLGQPIRLSSQEKTAAVTRVRWLEQQLFDGVGHVRRRVNRAQAQAIVDELNKLRASLGWLEIDLEGRWRWP